MLVRELLSTQLVTIDEATTLADAAERLLGNQVGSTIVVDGDSPQSTSTLYSDIVGYLSIIRLEAGGLASDRKEWESGKWVFETWVSDEAESEDGESEEERSTASTIDLGVPSSGDSPGPSSR